MSAPSSPPHLFPGGFLVSQATISESGGAFVIDLPDYDALLHRILARAVDQGPDMNINKLECFPEAVFEVFPAVRGRRATAHD